MYDLSVSWACREWEQLGITACKSLFKYLLCHLAVGWILDFFDFVLYLKKKIKADFQGASESDFLHVRLAYLMPDSFTLILLQITHLAVK